MESEFPTIIWFFEELGTDEGRLFCLVSAWVWGSGTTWFFGCGEGVFFIFFISWINFSILSFNSFISFCFSFKLFISLFCFSNFSFNLFISFSFILFISLFCFFTFSLNSLFSFFNISISLIFFLIYNNSLHIFLIFKSKSFFTGYKLISIISCFKKTSIFKIIDIFSSLFSKFNLLFLDNFSK